MIIGDYKPFFRQRWRQRQCGVELHYGDVLGTLSLLSLAVTRFHRRLGQNNPILQFGTTPTQSHANLKMVVRMRPVNVYFCSFLNLLLSIGCYPERKTIGMMINNVVLLFTATNEETPYEQLLLGIRDVARGFFFLRNG